MSEQIQLSGGRGHGRHLAALCGTVFHGNGSSYQMRQEEINDSIERICIWPVFIHEIEISQVQILDLKGGKILPSEIAARVS
jgi:hypothetical protein